MCKEVVFLPEGREGPTVKVYGLEGDACMMKVVLPEGQGPPAGAIPGVQPPYEMTCKIKNYAFGIKGPDDIIPYCEGSLKEIMKWCEQNPGMCPDEPGGRGPSQRPTDEGPPPEIILAFLEDGTGPEGCVKEKCVDYCRDNMLSCFSYIDSWIKKNGGPGGTKSLGEASAYCDENENSKECEQWMFSRGFTPSPQTVAQPAMSVETREQVVQNVREGGAPESCVGCLNNGNCDPGECAGCPDCR